jgi:hypothetical protein
MYVSVAIHEIGHLAVAKLVGMDAGGIMIGGLLVFKSGNRWVTRFEWRQIFSGGLARPLPKKGDFDMRRYAWMIAGGPIATFLLMAASGIAYWQAPQQSAGWLSTLWWMNVILGFSCMLPSKGISKSDGARLRMLLRNPQDSRSWIALLQLQTEDTAGVLPRDWDADLFAQTMQSASNGAENSYRQMLAYYRRIDEGDIDAALVHLETALAASATCGKMVRHWCFLEAACSAALFRRDSAKARTWLARAIRVRKPASKHGVEAAIAMSEHRYEDALRGWDAALAFLAKRKVDSGMVRLSKAKIVEYQAECRAALVTPPIVTSTHM